MKKIALISVLFISILASAQETYLHKIALKKSISLKRLEAIQDSLFKNSKLYFTESISAQVNIPNHELVVGMRHGVPEHFEVSIVDRRGKELIHQALDFDPTKINYTFDIHSLTPGFYYLRIYSEKTFLIRNFLLNK